MSSRASQVKSLLHGWFSPLWSKNRLGASGNLAAERAREGAAQRPHDFHREHAGRDGYVPQGRPGEMGQNDEGNEGGRHQADGIASIIDNGG